MSYPQYPQWKKWFSEKEAKIYTDGMSLRDLPFYEIGRTRIYDRDDLNKLRGEDPAEKKLFSLREASVYTAVPVGSLRRHIYELENMKPLIVGRAAVFTREQLDDFVVNGRTDIDPDPGYYMGSNDAAQYISDRLPEGRNMTTEYLGQLVHVEQEIKPIKVGNSLVFPRPILDAWLAGRKREPAPKPA